jgi:hypothetical protein
MEGQQTFEGAAQAPGKSKPESVTPPSPRGERKPLPPLVSQPQSLNAPSSAELPEPFAGRWRPNCGLLRQGGLPNQLTTDPDQDYNDQMNRRHCFLASKEGEARSGPDIRCWQAADPSSAPPWGRRETEQGRHELKGGEWTFSWATHSGLFSL